LKKLWSFVLELAYKTLRYVYRAALKDDSKYFYRLLLEEESGRFQHVLSYCGLKGSGLKFGRMPLIEQPRGLALGSDVLAGDFIKIYAKFGIAIGDGARLGNGVSIISDVAAVGLELSSDYLAFGSRAIVIGKNCWIGDGAVVMPGSKIRDGEFVSPYAVVSPMSPPLLHGDVGVSKYHGLSIKSSNNTVRKSVSASELGARMVFVVSIGRSGSKSIAHILNAHPGIIANHESCLLPVSLRRDFLSGLINDEAASFLIDEYYGKSIYKPGNLYVESDCHLGAFIPILAGLYPESKFIFLFRDPSSVIASCVGRGWFSEEDSLSDSVYSQSRVDGVTAGEFDVESWCRLSFFERNCWFWRYYNTLIYEDLLTIDSSRWMTLELDDISSGLSRVQEFLGVKAIDLEISISNRARDYKPYDISLWNIDECKLFESYCSDLYQKLRAVNAAKILRLAVSDNEITHDTASSSKKRR